MKKHRKNKNAPPPGLPLDEKPPIEEHPKKQPFLKRLLFGEETPDLSELEAGSTTILDSRLFAKRRNIRCAAAQKRKEQKRHKRNIDVLENIWYNQNSFKEYASLRTFMQIHTEIC